MDTLILLAFTDKAAPSFDQSFTEKHKSCCPHRRGLGLEAPQYQTVVPWPSFSSRELSLWP